MQVKNKLVNNAKVKITYSSRIKRCRVYNYIFHHVAQHGPTFGTD